MTDIILHALLNLLSGWHLFYMMVGVVVGLVIGVLPGLGGIAGVSILLPFIYGMDPVSALGMLIGLIAVVPTGDTFTSILMGIPGGSASQATILDGFPMAKRGEAARALAASFFSSMIGGLIGAAVLTVFVVAARPIILSFSSGELFMLTILGLSMVGVLSGASLTKGLLACGLGLLLGSIGAAPATSEWRMVLATDYLVDGIPLVIVGLGIFAIPEIIDLLRRNTSISETTGLGKGWMQGVRDTLDNWWLVVRCSAVGCIIGAMPGLGGSVANWVAYGHVVQTSKDRSQFGKGDVRGVLAPESANNAVQGGDLVPTLLFGIPGSGSTAIFLGGMILLGLQPGISLIENRLDLIYTIIWSLAIANVVGAGLCVLISRHVAYLTTLPYVLIAPFMLMAIFFASYQSTTNWGDLIVLVALGILGAYMRRFGWPRPPLLIGFVLARSTETYLYQAIQFHEWAWLWRPGVLIIGAFTLISLVLGMRYGRASIDEGGQTGRPQSVRPQILFGLFIAAAFSYGIYDSLKQSYLAKIFPLGLSIPALAAALVVLGVVLWGRRDHPMNFDTEAAEPEGILSMEHFMVWLIGFLGVSALFGFIIGLTIFFATFLHFKGRATIRLNAILTGSAVAFMVSMSYLFVVDFPSGLLQEYVDMPWPFR